MPEKTNIGNREVTSAYLRRALALQRVVDQMPHGTKYADVCELLSAFGFALGEDAARNYATDARRYLGTK